MQEKQNRKEINEKGRQDADPDPHADHGPIPASGPSSASPPAPAPDPAPVPDAGRMPALQIPNPIQHWRSRGYLPHLTVEDGTYFVTFRLGDSLPQAVLKEYQQEREALANRLKKQPGGMSEHDLREIERLYSEKVEAYLDAGAGSCVLRRPDVATLLANALQHFAEERYLLHAWVIMPNHVHGLITPRPPYQLEDILHSWKSFTANQINRLLNRKGETLWQRESYDHLVRGDQEFRKLKEYIKMNPHRAGLCQRPEDWPWLRCS